MLHGKLCGNHIYIQYLDLNSTKPNINPAAQNFIAETVAKPKTVNFQR